MQDLVEFKNKNTWHHDVTIVRDFLRILKNVLGMLRDAKCIRKMHFIYNEDNCVYSC